MFHILMFVAFRCTGHRGNYHLFTCRCSEEQDHECQWSGI